MTVTHENGGQRSFSSASLACVLLVVAAVCGSVLLALPRTAIPRDTPALHYSHAAARAVFDQDRKLAKQASTGAVALELDALLLEKGDSERKALEPIAAQQRRRERIADAVGLLRAVEGESALWSLRAMAVQRMHAALDLKLPKDEAQAVLGGFPTTLRETLATRDGVLVAPQLVVRTLYKVRWNVIMGLPMLAALEPVERLAYHGWFGLHVTTGPLDARISEVAAYAREGGWYAHEALGILAYRGGDPRGSRVELERAHAARPSLRVRNLIRSAKRAEFTMATLPPVSH